MTLVNVADPRLAAEMVSANDPHWYKDAIIYQLHVKSFADSNNDGVGDFAGLTEKLDYIQELGVTALWLLPFYPSPGKDDGYDISDYRHVNPDFGTMADFRRFMHEAKRRNLRVITELVVNHTSDQHAWFRRARRSGPQTDARNWYVWSDTDTAYSGTRIIFKDTEKSNWTWDPEAKAYYWHRFFSHQPDLNFANPRVLWAVTEVMKRWLDLGVDGFRLDAIPYLCEREGTNNENLPETHEVIKKIRHALDAHAPGKLLLAEANQWPEDVSAYFGDEDECHMAYHFPLMPRIYMAIAQEDRFPITDIMRQTPDIPSSCQWALFLRNHDELTLEMVTDAERDYLWSTYATDPRARINLGIRRRLAPLMDNDRRKIELMNSLLFSFPGTPIVYYGDEIGMGDNIYLGDRNGVRTPMQWTPDRNGGFSRSDPARLFAPPIMDAVYGYEAVNVEAQSRNLSSLLSWMKRIIAVRKSALAFGRGSISFLRPSNRAVIAYVREYNGDVILCVANLSRSAQASELDLSRWRDYVPREMLGRSEFPAIGELPYMITLAPYGFYWFQLLKQVPEARPQMATREFETLVMQAGASWPSMARPRNVLEREVLPTYLAQRRWFADKAAGSIEAQLSAYIPVAHPTVDCPWLAIVDVKKENANTSYALPIQVKWTRLDRDKPDARALAAVRQFAREGTLIDAAAELDFHSHLLKHLRANATIEGHNASLHFRASPLLTSREDVPIEEVKAVQTEQSNTTALIDGRYVVKLYRKVVPGINVEAEVGGFLTDQAPFPNTPAVLGTVEMTRDGQAAAIAIVHEFVENQGDGWTVTGGYVDRFVEEQRLLHTESESDEQVAYQRYVCQIGKRLAEMHLALASRDDVPDFAPQPLTRQDFARWTARILERALRIVPQLNEACIKFEPALREQAERLVGQSGQLEQALHAFLPDTDKLVQIRHHGDFHLGQTLVAKDDIYIIDFEGEPRRTLEERRQRAPAARDVAGLLRSIDYSATAALERALKIGPDDSGKLTTMLAAWRERSAETFLDAYFAAMKHPALWPMNRPASERLLSYFLLEKVFYEIEYEMNHRPAWLAVPLAGALRLLGEAPGATA